MVENKEKIDEGSKVVENSSEDENIDSSEESEVVEKEKSAEIIEEEKDNIIYIGIKPFMNYVTGVVMQFQNKEQDEVIVSARGKFISKAVDVVEVARRTFLKDEDIKIKNIGINSEQFENKEGKRIFVSTIEIKLIKN